MKKIKLILVLFGLLSFSTVMSQTNELVVHVCGILTYQDGRLEESSPADFWLTMKPLQISIPQINFEILIVNSRYEDQPMEKGGTVSEYEAILVDDENQKYAVLLTMMYYKDKSFIGVDWLNGVIIYYIVDKFY